MAPTPALDIPAQVRLSSHADAPTELLVVDHPQSRDFVVAVAAAVEAINRTEGSRVALTVLQWKHDRGAAKLPPLEATPVERIAVATRFDVWAQDFVEIAAAGEPGAERLVLLDPNRGRRSRPAGGLGAFVPELALRWRADWVRLPRMNGSATGAGNVEGLPDGLLLLGSTAGRGWADFLIEHGHRERHVRVDTSWLAIGHVDELVSHVVTGPGPCDFALVRASPALGLALVRAEILAGAGNLPGWLRGRVGTFARPSAFDRTQARIEAQLAAATAEIRGAIAAHGCAPPAVVELPTLFRCEGGPANPEECRTVLPNAVNMTVLGRHLLVADPGFAPFRNAILRALEASGQTVHLIESESQHERRGGIHCATNVRRFPLRREGPHTLARQ